jgi:micrococcal nuclease
MGFREETRATISRPSLPIVSTLALVLSLTLTACTDRLPSAADTADPWVGSDAGGGTMLDPAGLLDVVLDEVSHPVTWVSDGDTIKVRRAGKTETMRLLGINAPESVDPRRPVQCFGKEASKRLKALAEGRRVFIATDPTQDRIDRFGRTLVYAWLEDGTFLNLEMVRGGYASEYTYGQPCLYRDLFRDAQTEAQRADRGLWAAETCAGDYAAPADDFSDIVDPFAPSRGLVGSGEGGVPGGNGASGGGGDSASGAAGSEGAAGADPRQPRLRIGQVVYDPAQGEAIEEYIEIINDGPPLDVEGWRLHDLQGNTFVFPAFTMATDRRCRVYTAQADPAFCGLSFFEDQPVWGNGGDVATLVDPAGTVVDERCWRDGCS